MTTVLTRQARVASAISGHGDLTAAATYQLRIAASISGNGNLVSALTRQARLVAAVDGNGNMSSAMRLIAHLQAPLSGHGDMTAAAIGSTSTPAVRRKKRRGDMSFTFQQKVVSTATPLLSSAVYTSSIIESNLFGMLTGVVYADQAGVFTLQAWNEANGTYYTVYTLSVVGGVASPITHDIIAPKYKAVYTNAGTNQTVFALTLYINT